MRRALIITLVILALIGGIAWWWFSRPVNTGELVLYGNVDLRQAELAFNNSERIDVVLVQEGDRVKKGQLLAQLDTSRIVPQYEQAQAMADAQRQVVQRMHNGSRPEEIAQARANLESAKADAENAHTQYDRVVRAAHLSDYRAVSQQDLDNAKAAADVADAKVAVAQKALELEIAGPRKEDVAQAEAQLRGNDAMAALAHRQVIDTNLFAPQDGVIRSRLMEPGEMASPTKAVFSMAIVDPKWVRAYVSEPDLGKVHPGMSASIMVDSFPNKKFEGWVGFISPVAEFTPKTVQTEELRSSLVYEVRVFVHDPSDDLRLGMPATVNLSGEQATTQPTTQPD